MGCATSKPDGAGRAPTSLFASRPGGLSKKSISFSNNFDYMPQQLWAPKFLEPRSADVILEQALNILREGSAESLDRALALEGSDGSRAICERLAGDEQRRYDEAVEDCVVKTVQPAFTYFMVMHSSVLEAKGLGEGDRAIKMHKLWKAAEDADARGKDHALYNWCMLLEQTDRERNEHEEDTEEGEWRVGKPLQGDGLAQGAYV